MSAYTATMSILPEKLADWTRGLAKNAEPYGRRCYTYADAWATLMEQRIAKGEQLADIAASTSHEADTDGISGFMYGAAVGILSRCWVHGEALRRWHNKATQLHDEGDKANETGRVLNPALLVVTGKG